MSLIIALVAIGWLFTVGALPGAAGVIIGLSALLWIWNDRKRSTTQLHDLERYLSKVSQGEIVVEPQAISDQVHRSLQTMAERLQRTDRMRRDFVANVSHELRTPITLIKGFVETLRDGALESPGDTKRFLDIIATQSDRLTAIIEDLLTLASIEHRGADAQVPRDAWEVSGLIREVLSDSEQAAADKGIVIDSRVEFEGSALINGPFIRQAVGNLLINAIRYSLEGSRVEVIARAEGSSLVIEVKDFGIGIERHHHQRIFERFYVVDKARSRRVGGTGLGLAIVKHIALLHRGGVDVQSEIGKGSTFTLVIPESVGSDSQARSAA